MEEGNNKGKRGLDQENDGDKTSAERHSLRAQYQREKASGEEALTPSLFGVHLTKIVNDPTKSAQIGP